MARLAYTYLHMPIVAGIVVAAVGDELVLAHPDGHSDAKTVLSIVGGPLLFLVGVILFKRTIHGWLQLSHLVGIGALLVLAPFAHHLSPLILSAATTAILLIVGAWEAISIGDKRTLRVEIRGPRAARGLRTSSWRRSRMSRAASRMRAPARRKRGMLYL